jgi:hypothetical protein
MDAMENALLWRDFETIMRDHLAEHHRVWCASQTAEEIGVFIRAGIQKAKGYGATEPRTYGLVLELMLEFGADFDTSADHAWASELLRATERRYADGDARIDALFAAAVANGGV